MSGALNGLLRTGVFGATAGAGAVTMMNPNGLAGVASVVNGITGGMRNSQNNHEIVGLLKPLSDQVFDLSNEVSRLRMQNSYSMYPRTTTSWLTVFTVGGVGVFVLYSFGFTFNDFMYVTKKALAVAVEVLEESITNVGAALETARRELSYKIGLIEDKVETTRLSLEEKITQEVGDVKSDLAAVGGDVRAVAQGQEEVQGMVLGLESKVDYLATKMEDESEKLTNANNGIQLLVNATLEKMREQKSLSAFYNDLVAYTENTWARVPKPNLWRTNSDSNDSPGLKLLVPKSEAQAQN